MSSSWLKLGSGALRVLKIYLHDLLMKDDRQPLSDVDLLL